MCLKDDNAHSRSTFSTKVWWKMDAGLGSPGNDRLQCSYTSWNTLWLVKSSSPLFETFFSPPNDCMNSLSGGYKALIFLRAMMGLGNGFYAFWCFIYNLHYANKNCKNKKLWKFSKYDSVRCDVSCSQCFTCVLGAWNGARKIGVFCAWRITSTINATFHIIPLRNKPLNFSDRYSRLILCVRIDTCPFFMACRILFLECYWCHLVHCICRF